MEGYTITKARATATDWGLFTPGGSQKRWASAGFRREVWNTIVRGGRRRERKQTDICQWRWRMEMGHGCTGQAISAWRKGYPFIYGSQQKEGSGR